MIFWTVLSVFFRGEMPRVCFIEKGSAQSAPDNPRIAKKFLVTAVISVLIWGIVFALIQIKVIDFHQRPRVSCNMRIDNLRLEYATRRVLLLTAVTLFSVPAFAQSENVLTTYCYRLADYQQDKGVNYTAGSTADGRAVVPADINASSEINTAFAVPLTIDLAERYNLPTRGR